jgi:hypothetical protein
MLASGKKDSSWGLDIPEHANMEILEAVAVIAVGRVRERASHLLYRRAVVDSMRGV